MHSSRLRPSLLRRSLASASPSPSLSRTSIRGVMVQSQDEQEVRVPTYVGSAFNPGQFLHPEIVQRHQQNAFRRAMNENYLGIKDMMTDVEIKKIEAKFDHLGDIRHVENKLKQLLGQERYFHLRFTRTMTAIREKVLSWIETHGVASLVFATEPEFREFKATCSFWGSPTFSKYTEANLRFLAAVFSIETLEQEVTLPLSLMVSGYNPHYPDPATQSADFMAMKYGPMSKRKIIHLSAVQAVKENRFPSLEYIEELAAQEGHPFSEPSWRAEIDIMRHEQSLTPVWLGVDMFKYHFGATFCGFHDGIYQRNEIVAMQDALTTNYRKWLPSADDQDKIYDAFGPDHPYAADHSQHIPDIRDEHQPSGVHGPYDEQGRKAAHGKPPTGRTFGPGHPLFGKPDPLVAHLQHGHEDEHH